MCPTIDPESKGSSGGDGDENKNYETNNDELNGDEVLKLLQLLQLKNKRNNNEKHSNN